MSPRLRVAAAVAVAAVAAAGAVVGVTLATRQTPAQPRAIGKPPLTSLVPASPAVRAAYAEWPHGTLDDLGRLVRERPRDPAVAFYYGLALVSAGYDADAETALRRAKRLGRDTWTEQLADSLLHPQFFAHPPYPPFQPVSRDPLLLRGARLQAEGHQRSAERVWARAARLRPGDDEAQVAAAVGLYDKDDPARAFGRLGPLTARFPRSQSVRFHLALLLAWQGDRARASRQFRAAARLGAKTVLGREAKAFLDRLGAGTK